MSVLHTHQVEHRRVQHLATFSVTAIVTDTKCYSVSCPLLLLHGWLCNTTIETVSNFLQTFLPGSLQAFSSLLMQEGDANTYSPWHFQRSWRSCQLYILGISEESDWVSWVCNTALQCIFATTKNSFCRSQYFGEDGERKPAPHLPRRRLTGQWPQKKHNQVNRQEAEILENIWSVGMFEGLREEAVMSRLSFSFSRFCTRSASGSSDHPAAVGSHKL